jgi:hypothetical protein
VKQCRYHNNVYFQLIISSSPETTYYGSCGEGSPGSSTGFLDDLIEIKEEVLEEDISGDGTGDISLERIGTSSLLDFNKVGANGCS